uniref:Uncharacterized protein n=1 Tax=Homalodisca liturata TaxID=320908 RepID=A0A1B6J764_9HEMI
MGFLQVSPCKIVTDKSSTIRHLLSETYHQDGLYSYCYMTTASSPCSLVLKILPAVVEEVVGEVLELAAWSILSTLGALQFRQTGAGDVVNPSQLHGLTVRVVQGSISGLAAHPAGLSRVQPLAAGRQGVPPETYDTTRILGAFLTCLTLYVERSGAVACSYYREEH